MMLDMCCVRIGGIHPPDAATGDGGHVRRAAAAPPRPVQAATPGGAQGLWAAQLWLPRHD